MASEQDANKDIVWRVFEDLLPQSAFPAELETIVHPDYEDHDAADAAASRGLASIRATHACLQRRLGSAST